MDGISITLNDVSLLVPDEDAQDEAEEDAEEKDEEGEEDTTEKKSKKNGLTETEKSTRRRDR